MQKVSALCLNLTELTQYLIIELLVLPVQMILTLKLLNKLILILDDGLDAQAAHEPVVLQPLLEIGVFELVTLTVLVNFLE